MDFYNESTTKAPNRTLQHIHAYDCLSETLCHLIIFIYVAIFVVALISNVAICYVILCKKSMHTTTNCYLFNLSMADLIHTIFGITSQVEIVVNTDKFFSSGVKCLIHSIAKETSMNVSVLTITAFTVERYVAICHPFIARVMSETSRVIKLLIAIWIISALSSLPYIKEYSIITEGNSTSCKINKTAISLSLEISTMVLFFIIPIITISVIHMLIGLNLANVTTSDEKRASTYLQINKSTKKTLRILVVIAVTVFMCWAPERILRLLSIYLNNIKVDVALKWKDSHCIMYVFGQTLNLLSTIMNPLIFSIMSSKFRNALKDLSQEAYQKVRTSNRCATSSV